jgi:hypothetical protein
MMIKKHLPYESLQSNPNLLKFFLLSDPGGIHLPAYLQPMFCMIFSEDYWGNHYYPSETGKRSKLKKHVNQRFVN